ncbi:MAG: hypothetical protein IAE65_06795 [Ignavibacteria bacterium]|nr:hypothetical protein [Ignavibacteria bacterium]
MKLNKFKIILFYLLSFSSCSHYVPLPPDTFQYKQFVEVKILGVDSVSYINHNLIYGKELISNHEINLISEKDTNFIFDINYNDIEKIYPFKTYRFEILKAPSNIAMLKDYPRLNGFAIDYDGGYYVRFWFNGKFEVDVYTSPNLIDKYYIKK